MRWCEEQGRKDDLIIINPDDKNVLNLLDHNRGKEPIMTMDDLMNLTGLNLCHGGGQNRGNAIREKSSQQRLHRFTLPNQLSMRL